MTEMVNPSLAERIQRVGKRHIKRGYFNLARPERNPLPVFVLGYGRSGTTMLIDAFEHDWRIEVFQENDPRMASNYEVRWDRIADAAHKCGAPVALFKPILNSFDIARLLDLDRRSFAIWMFRDVDPVVRSSLKKFGDNVVTLLRNLVTGADADSWLGRGVPPDVLHELRELNHQAFTTEDWMALVWWSVNRTLTDAPANVRERIQVIDYGQFLRDPNTALHGIYASMQLPARPEASRWIGNPASNGTKALSLSPEVRELCTQMRTQIESLYLNKPDDSAGEHRGFTRLH